MEKKEKNNNKTLTVILFILLIVSLVGNMVLSKTNSEFVDKESELIEENTELDKFIKYLNENGYSYSSAASGNSGCTYVHETKPISISLENNNNISIQLIYSDPDMDEESKSSYTVYYDANYDKYYMEYIDSTNGDLSLFQYYDGGASNCYGTFCNGFYTGSEAKVEEFTNKWNTYAQNKLDDLKLNEFIKNSKVDFSNLGKELICK